VARAGHHVGQAAERPEAVSGEQAGAEQDVLVGKGEQGATVLVGHDRLHGDVCARIAVDAGEADEQRRRAADAF